jgi:hypothetical protein
MPPMCLPVVARERRGRDETNRLASGMRYQPSLGDLIRAQIDLRKGVSVRLNPYPNPCAGSGRPAMARTPDRTTPSLRLSNACRSLPSVTPTAAGRQARSRAQGPRARTHGSDQTLSSRPLAASRPRPNPRWSAAGAPRPHGFQLGNPASAPPRSRIVLPSASSAQMPIASAPSGQLNATRSPGAQVAGTPISSLSIR